MNSGGGFTRVVDGAREPTNAELMDAITAVQGTAITPEDMTEAVATGIRTAVSDPKLWSAALTAMQTHAQTQAGGWLFGWIKGIASKLMLFIVFGLAVYSMGGWSALLMWIKGGGSAP